MARIEDLAPTFGRFVDAEGRRALEGRPLDVQDVREDNANTYGPRWLVVVADLGTGELITIGMAKNAGRDALYPRLIAMLAEGHTVDPLCLYQFKPEKGNAFWTFRSATDAELAAARAEREAGDTAPADEPPVLGKGGKAK